MNPKTKKILIISGAVAVVGLSVYFLTKKKDDAKLSSTSNNPAIGSNSNINQNNDTDANVIGKKAYALNDGVFVYSDAKTKYTFFSPNGYLLKNEDAGRIIATKKGSDDNLLYYQVLRDKDYSCPYSKCSVGYFFNENSGWVLASEVKLG